MQRTLDAWYELQLLDASFTQGVLKYPRWQ